MAEQTLPDCGEHQGECARCGIELKVKPKTERAKQPARAKAVYSTRIPKDAAENGYEVLGALIEANKYRLAESFGWSESVPDYYVLCAVLAEGLQ